MVDSAPTEIVGLANAVNDLRNWTDQLGHQVITGGVETWANSTAADVRSKVPVLTGTLLHTVRVIPPVEDQLAISMGESVIYAPWIEYGGSRGRDRVTEGRYVYPTVKQHESQLGPVVEQAVTNSINERAWVQAK